VTRGEAGAITGNHPACLLIDSPGAARRGDTIALPIGCLCIVLRPLAGGLVAPEASFREQTSCLTFGLKLAWLKTIRKNCLAVRVVMKYRASRRHHLRDAASCFQITAPL